MSVLSYISTTSLFIQITSTNTRLTSVKCSVGSVKMVCTRPQMFLPPRYGGISRLYSFAIWFNDGPCQSPNYPRLARTTQDQGDSIIPRIHQLLPSVHTCLLGYRYSSTRLTHKDTKWDF